MFDTEIWRQMHKICISVVNFFIIWRQMQKNCIFFIIWRHSASSWSQLLHDECYLVTYVENMRQRWDSAQVSVHTLILLTMMMEWRLRWSARRMILNIAGIPCTRQDGKFKTNTTCFIPPTANFSLKAS